MEDNCKLCGQTANLVKSHVIPQALHKDILPDDDVIKLYATGQDYGKKSLTGIYGQFLCQCCENYFAPYDDYGVKVVRKYADGETGKPLLGSFEKGFAADVDYTKLKLWVLSMLWRADACDHECFERIELGDKWRKKLTAMLQSQSPGSVDDFAVTATLFDNDLGQQSVSQSIPAKIKADNNYRRSYWFYVPRGFRFVIKVDQRKQLPELEPLTLREGEPFPIVRRGFSKDEKKTLETFADSGSTV